MNLFFKKWFLLIIVFFVILWGSEKIYRRIGGTYPAAVGMWELKISEKELVEIIKEIKKESLMSNNNIINGYTKSKYDESLGFWFYYPDTKEVISACVTSTDSPHIKQIHLISITDSNNVSKKINGDYGPLDTWMQLNKFKKRVLNPIEHKIEERGGSVSE